MTANEMRISDWSSDVCSSDLGAEKLAAEAAPTRAQWLELARSEDLRQVIRRAFDALQVRITQAAVVVDVDGAVAVERLDQQPDRRLVVLRGLDRVLHHLLAVFDVVDRDDGHAGADAGVERRTVPAHFADAAGLVEVDAERINEAGAAASVLRLRLFVGVG